MKSLNLNPASFINNLEESPMKSIKQLFIALFAFGFMAATGASYAQSPPETPPAVPAGIKVKLIGAKEVQDLQAKGAVLVDTRRANEYAEKSIKGAKSVPYDPEKSAKTSDGVFDSSLDKFDLSQFPDKNAHIVMFCNSGTCFKSYKAAVVAAKAGYTNVYWYRDGLPDWTARKLPTE